MINLQSLTTKSVVQSPLGQSLLYHLGLAAIIFLISVMLPNPQKLETYQISIREKVNQAPLAPLPENLEISQNKPLVPKETAAPEAFGLNNQSLTSSQSEAQEVKLGNTLTKEIDQIQSDGAALPIPVENFLVTRMPLVKKEVRLPYPAKAKAQGLEGTVLAELLIDETGAVRGVILIKGVGAGLDEVALSALRQYEFEPALIEDKAVPVQIRFSYKFILD